MNQKHIPVMVQYYDHTAYTGEPGDPLILTEIGFVHSHSKTWDGHKYLVLSVGFDSQDEYNNPYMIIMLDEVISIQRLKPTGREMSWRVFNR